MKVLIVEDEKAISDTLVTALRKEGYVTEQVDTYSKAWDKIALFSYDCILLDIGLPGGSGLDLLRMMKKENISGGVIIISARDATTDKVEGLNLGADDYLAKPFHISELLARVSSIIRRRNNDGSNSVHVGNMIVHIDKGQVCIDGRQIDLSKKEYDILLHFALRKGRTISKENLAESVWGDHIDQVDNFDFIYTHLKNLRRKLSASGATFDIKSVYGFGYKLVEST